MMKYIALLLLLLSSNLLSAQSVDEKATNMLKGGVLTNDVYVVVACIFLGLLFYLVRMERKLSKLEKQIGNDTTK